MVLMVGFRKMDSPEDVKKRFPDESVNESVKKVSDDPAKNSQWRRPVVPATVDIKEITLEGR